MYNFLRHNLMRAFCMVLTIFFAMFLLFALFSADDPASRGEWWAPGLDYYIQIYAPYLCLASGFLLLVYAGAYAVTELLDRRERSIGQKR